MSKIPALPGGGNPATSTPRLATSSPADAWHKHAEPLADWAMVRSVVRKDVYGAYRHNGGTYTAHEPLSRDLLIRHFRGETTIGTHSTSPDGRCLWLAFDIDAHTEADDPERNWRCALAIVGVFAGFGLKALVIDSNGKGGYHVRPFFKKPVYSAVARWLCDQVEAALKAAGFPIPESFPKQGELSIDTPFGNWIRLPGKHHKRDHWTRIYDPELGRWLEGEDAALRLIKIAGDDAGPLLKAYAARPEAAEADPAKERSRKERPKDGARDVELARDALGFIPNDGAGLDYDPWIGIGMALCGLGSDGRSLFHEWSSRSSKYDRETTDRKFDSFSPDGGITLGSLFHRATETGWKRPPPPEPRRNGPTVAGPNPSGNGHPTKATDAELGLTGLATVEAVELVWLWPGRIPLGKITLIAGEGGVGKSFMSLDWATIISRGAVWPDAPDVPVEPGHVILLSAEDDLADTVVPRLKAMGADLNRIDALGTAIGPNGVRLPFTLADILRLEQVMERRPGTRMIVVDPAPAFLPAGIDDHKNAELRAILGPLSDFAAKYHVAIILITHFNKSSGSKAAARIIGSVAYSNAARASWCVAADPEDDNRRLLMPVKANLSPERSSMAFTIADGVVKWERDPLKLNVNEILAGGPHKQATARRNDCIEWLQALLAGGPLPSEEVITLAAAAGFGKNLVWEVKDAAGVRAKKNGMDGTWAWVLNVAPDIPDGF